MLFDHSTRRFHLPRLAAAGGLTFLAGAGLLACFAAIGRIPDLPGENLIPFLAYFSLACALYLLAVLRLEREALPLKVLWGLAILFRAALLFQPPGLSDDVYRYAWDGRLLTQGANPYALPVNSPLLDANDFELRAQVNHPWMASPYLPAAQALFALVMRLSPQNMPQTALPAFQISAIIFDLLTGWLVMDLLARLGLPPQRALIYLWNPLVVVEFAHAAHIDSWMLFLTLLAGWCLLRAAPDNPRRDFWSSASVLALAAATLTKGAPVLFAPLFLRRWGFKRSLLYLLLLVGVCGLFAAGAGWGLSGPLDGRGLFGALRIYLSQWNYNSSLYHWLEAALTGVRSPGAAPVTPETAAPIWLARQIAAAALGLVSLAGLVWAWKRTGYRRGQPAALALDLLRLAALLSGAYLLLTATLHPWYVTLILPFLAFLLPAPGQTNSIRRFVWPWLYLSCAVAFSYLTYIDPADLHEYALIRPVEYAPFFLLMLWASLPYLGRIRKTRL